MLLEYVYEICRLSVPLTRVRICVSIASYHDRPLLTITPAWLNCGTGRGLNAVIAPALGRFRSVVPSWSYAYPCTTSTSSEVTLFSCRPNPTVELIADGRA